MSLSTHKAEVFRVEDISAHPNADNLDIVRYYGYVCCVRRGDFHPGDMAVYIPPDSLVPTGPGPFAFLATDAYPAGHRYAGLARVRARRFRGVMSQGLVVPAPAGYNHGPGDDLATALLVQHYEPGEPRRNGASIIAGPSVEGPYMPVYDLESWFRYGYLIEPGTEVVVTEKLHGTNVRMVHDGTQLHVGSRRQWKGDMPNSVYWQTIRSYQAVMDFLASHPGVCLYGEIFGDVQDLKYGHAPGARSLAIFDCFVNGQFKPVPPGLPIPPVLYAGPYDPVGFEHLIDGMSHVDGAKHVREGVVIQPDPEQWSITIGRVKLKAVSSAYLERAK